MEIYLDKQYIGYKKNTYFSIIKIVTNNIIFN